MTLRMDSCPWSMRLGLKCDLDGGVEMVLNSKIEIPFSFLSKYA